MYCKIKEIEYNNKIILCRAGLINPFILGGRTCLSKIKNAPKLALDLLCDLCASLIDYIKKIITSKDFISRHKKASKDFTRNRSLPLSTVLLFLMNLLKSSIQNELDSFCKAVSGSDVADREVTDSAFCQARKKLSHSAFIELMHKGVEFFTRHFSPKTWHGFRLLAVDGSTIKVPRTEEVSDYFGAWNPAKGERCPVARISQMFDVLNHISIDALIAPKSHGERDLAAQHFAHSGHQDLILLDRGYPALWLFHLILHQGAHFCARLPIHLWKIARRFSATGLNEKIVMLYPTPVSKKMCAQLGLPATPLQLRLIRIDLGTEEPEVLITSLLDTAAYPHALFKELYHDRWPIEESYKLFKSRIELENFTGKSVEAVKQDFYARVFMLNLTSMLAFPVQDHVDANHKDCTYLYQINWTQALAKMKNVGILLFIREKIAPMIENLQKLFLRSVVPIRPGRKFPRKPQFHQRRFAFAYKPIS
jgi:hypothetical protein